MENLCKEQRLEEAFQVVMVLQERGFAITRDLIYSLLQGCIKANDLASCRRVHWLMASSGFDGVVVLVDHLIRLFTSCKSLQDANRVFCRLPKPTIHTWNALMTAHIKLGEEQRALGLFYMMEQFSIRPDKFTFLCALKACSNIQGTDEGRLIHKQIMKTNLGEDIMLGNAIIDMYAKCGSLEEAIDVFENLSNPDAVSWGAMITGYVQHGQALPALELFEKVLRQGIKPGKVMFLGTFKACGILSAIVWGRWIHDELIRSDVEVDLVIKNCLIDMYIKCEVMADAQALFQSLQIQDEVSWGTMIAGYVMIGEPHQAFQLFTQMRQQGLKISSNIFSCVVKACGLIQDVVQGMVLHDLIIVTGTVLDTVVYSSLVDMYIKCETLQEARKVFDAMPHRDLVSWGAMIAGYCALGHGLLAFETFAQMQEYRIKPDKAIIVGLVQACCDTGSVNDLMLMQHYILETELDADRVIASIFIDLYAKCGCLKEANLIFGGLQSRDLVSCCSMITGYISHGHSSLALDLYEKMQCKGIEPNRVVLLCTLQACGSLGSLRQSRIMHDQVIKRNFDSDAAIGNTLIDIYCKSGSIETARRVFDALCTINAVHWGTMMSSYVMHGQDFAALQIFQRAQDEGVEVNTFMFSSILKACGTLKEMGKGRLIHNKIITNALEMDAVVGNSLILMYSKQGKLEDASWVLNNLQNRDAVSWATMIAAHAEHGHGLRALHSFAMMQKEGVCPSMATFVCTLKACGSIGALPQGRIIHNLIIIEERENDIVIGSTLVELYSKSGNVEEAWQVLSKLPHQDVVAWGALIAGCAHHGNTRLARCYFHDMLGKGLNPDKGVFTGLLAACSQEGLIEEGHQFFVSMMRDFKMSPGVMHYSCMIDLFGRAGCFEKAKDLLEIMPVFPDMIVWMSLLTSCKIYTNVKLASWCFAQLLKLETVDAACYMLMSNIYADAHLWQDAERVHELRKSLETKKQPGTAWLKVDYGVHEFVVGRQNNPQSDDVCVKIENLWRLTRNEGFVALLNLVLEPFSNENRDETVGLCRRDNDGENLINFFTNE